VTTRQERRPNPTIRARARRALTAPIVAALAVGLAVTATQVPVQAAAPAVAQSWSALMYRSLTRQQTAATLRTTLTAHQSTVVTRTAEITRATTASTLARTQVTTAGTAVTAAQTGQAAAQTALTTAKQNLTKASKKKKPRNPAAITRAKNAVTAATKTLTLRQTQTKTAVAALSTAEATARTAAATLTAATTARESAATALRATQQRLAALPTATSLAEQASALSKNVVSQARTGFAVADTTNIYGTIVHRNVAYAFKRMVDDARANGILISGGGFRTRERQIELRKINGCPDVWSAPSSSCRVPTAVPGRSLHELGLAVDITAGGKSLTRGTPAFKWLSLHAKAYGFVNLPSEAWHWSITGG